VSRRIGLRWGVALGLALATARAAAAAAPYFPGVATASYAGTDPSAAIPDNGSIVSMIAVPATAGVVVDVDVTVDLPHTQPDNLDVYLVSPLGTTVTLTTDNGGGNDDVFANATFDDQATGTPSAPNVRNRTYANLVSVGVVQPEEALGAVVGEAAEGLWALVVVDDANGSTGTLRSWSLTITTAPGLRPGAAVDWVGTGANIPDGNSGGRVLTVDVTSGARLYDVDLTVAIDHPRADDIDIVLTSPSGRRIDVVTDVGGSTADLWNPTRFDDQAGLPASDETVVPGTPFARIVGEGALSAFLGEDPRGIWTLTVVDDTGGNSGRIDGWTLSIVSSTSCGDGSLDAGEVCDDGNLASGDGCDANCTATACGNGAVGPGEDCDDGNQADGDTCPADCKIAETDCGNCLDDDGDGLVDAADPGCDAVPFTVGRAKLNGRRPKAVLDLNGKLALPMKASGSVSLLLTDASGTIVCTTLGTMRAKGRAGSVRGKAAGGTVAVRWVKGAKGTVVVAGRKLAVDAPADGKLTVGIGVGDRRFVAAATLRGRGRHKVAH
jgi:cysteine-rich repeat protein